MAQAVVEQPRRACPVDTPVRLVEPGSLSFTNTSEVEMKKALTDGSRICEIVNDSAEFEVHSSLVWVDVADDTTCKDTWVDDAVVKFSIPAMTMIDLRSKRDALLANSDWTQVADAPGNTAAWATYRQALRDLPANTADPADITWPTPPA